MRDFITFRTMLTPKLVKIIFWLGTLLCIASCIYTFIKFKEVKRSLEVLILGPIFLRVACEMLLLHFNINENLNEIKRSLNTVD